MARRKAQGEKRASRAGAREPLDSDGLTQRQRIFCLELVNNGGDGAAAARFAGYSARCAAQQAHENLQKPAIKAFLEPRLRRRVERLELKAERLDEELARIAYVDPRKLVDPATGRRLELHELDEDTARAIGKVKVKFVKVVRGKKVAAAAAGLGVDTSEEQPPVEEISLGVQEVSFHPKVEAIGQANKILGRLKDKLEVTAKLSHEQLLVLATRVRERKLAARAGAAGGKPGAPARGVRP